MGASSSSSLSSPSPPPPVDYDSRLLSDVSLCHSHAILPDGTIPIPTLLPSPHDGHLTYIQNGSWVRRSAKLPNQLSRCVLEGVSEVNGGKGYSTLWELFSHGVKKYPDSPCLGTREFILSEDQKSLLKHSDDNSHQRGKYVWKTFSEVNKEAMAIGKGVEQLLSLESSSSSSSPSSSRPSVGILSFNRAEWTTSELSLFSQRIPIVTIYTSMGEKIVHFILSQSECKAIFCAKECLQTVLDAVAWGRKQEKDNNNNNNNNINNNNNENKTDIDTANDVRPTSLLYVIQYDVDPLYQNIHDTVDSTMIEKFHSLGITLIGLSSVRNKGMEILSSSSSPSSSSPSPSSSFPLPSDPAFLMYTSGTTGNPKAAIILHSNLISTISISNVDGIRVIRTHDRHFSYLPQAHLFETVVQLSLFVNGARCAFSSNNIKRLTEDMREIQPTFFIGVPRVFNRLYAAAMANITSLPDSVQQKLYSAYESQRISISSGKKMRDMTLHAVFAPLRNSLGLGSCERITTASAPLSSWLAEVIRTTICVLNSAWGLTEASAAGAITSENEGTLSDIFHCGGPSPCNEAKLVDVKELGYSTDDIHPRGEVWLRGPNCISGYYKDPVSTAELLRPDGWISTGDIGRWNPNGTLSIIDRKKNIFKLSHGEYVAPEKIENVYLKSPYIQQIWIYGNPYKTMLVGVVVVAGEGVRNIGREKGWWKEGEGEEKSRVGTTAFIKEYKENIEGPHSEDIKQIVLHSMSLIDHHVLNGFEKVKHIILESDIDVNGMGFTEKNECLTATFKTRRGQLVKRYRERLQAVYEKMGEKITDEEKEMWGK